ncbi:MAG TPA: phospholipase D-like domain-containing protein, partial [Kofleriaceae bacterium]|nr:phospholipase D-like domain-containing protein [Kofleriaceae bacterium]
GAACREGGDAFLDASLDSPPDGVDGTGCTPRTPRTMPVQAFTGPAGLHDRIAAAIDGAQTSLDIQMYLFSVKDLAQHVVAARQRGVAIRVILDPGESANGSVETILSTGGVQWKHSASVYQYSHAKYLVIDRSTAIVMSMNFNPDAMTKERNYGFVDQDPEDVTDVQNIFEMDWQLAQGKTPVAADLTCTRMIVSPVNSFQRVLDFINSAKTTLDVEVMYIADASIQAAIGNAATRGATVRVIVEDPNDTPQNAGVAAFMSPRGIPVKYAVQQFYLHAKLLVADGVAFVGSENMSTTSMTGNREVGALVFEPDQAAIIQQQFEADWAITTPAM